MVTNSVLRIGMYVVCALCMVFGSTRAVAQSRANKPNIIVFLVDDMGWQDTSVPFGNTTTPLNRLYKTPNMERLAAAGVKFTHAYAMPVCTPTRVSIITGSNAARTRVTQWTSPYRDKSTDHPDSVMLPVDWNINGFSPVKGVASTFSGTALPKVLRDNGYYTVHSGKAHFASADTPGSNPLNLGFDVNIAGSEIGHPASYFGRDNFDRPANGKPNRNAVPGLDAYHGKDAHLTDVLTTEALKAIDVPIGKKQPFFLYLAHYAVHTPIQADERFAGKYRDAGLDSVEAAYAALVEGMDKSLGQLLDFIAERGIGEHTVIIFTSDNGGLSRVPPRGGNQADVHNAPLRAGKGSVYEGGIRVPLIVSWPGKISPGSTSQHPVIVEDLFPTILEAAFIRSPKVSQTIDGKSYLRMLTNTTLVDTSRALVFHHPNRWIPGEGQLTAWAGALVKGDWKLLYDYRKGIVELYNLRTDISEQHNVVQSRPAKALELAKLFKKELQSRSAQMPTFRDGRAVPWPEQILAPQKSIK